MQTTAKNNLKKTPNWGKFFGKFIPYLKNMAQIITLQEAQELTFAYQDSAMAVNQTIATSVDKTSILNLLNQPNCEGMRMYFGLDENNKLTLVIVGTNNLGNDMTTGQILDRMNLCPFYCDNNSSLIQP